MSSSIISVWLLDQFLPWCPLLDLFLPFKVPLDLSLDLFLPWHHLLDCCFLHSFCLGHIFLHSFHLSYYFLNRFHSSNSFLYSFHLSISRWSGLSPSCVILPFISRFVFHARCFGDSLLPQTLHCCLDANSSSHFAILSPARDVSCHSVLFLVHPSWSSVGWFFFLVFPFFVSFPHLVRFPSSKYLVTSLVVLRYFQKPDHYNCQSGNISGPVFNSRLEQTNYTCQSSNFNGAVFAYFSFCFNY